MQTENDTPKPEDSPKQATGEGCPEATCSASWVPWPRGWGWTMALHPGIGITVSKGMARTDGFKWSALGLTGKTHYAKPEDAKRAAVEAVRRILTKSLNSLPNAKHIHPEPAISDDTNQ